jgi:hypothetical protein
VKRRGTVDMVAAFLIGTFWVIPNQILMGGFAVVVLLAIFVFCWASVTRP